MKKLITMSTLLAAALSVSACKKSSQTKATTVPTADRSGGAKTNAGPQRQTAENELREALLALQRVHFGFDTATLLPAARDSLERAARHLASHPDVHLYVDGHTDDRGTTEYNIALGDRRANAVIDYLARLGIARDRLHAVSFGEERPHRHGEAPDDRAANRRVEFRLMRGNVQFVLEDGTRFLDDGSPLDNKQASR